MSSTATPARKDSQGPETNPSSKPTTCTYRISGIPLISSTEDVHNLLVAEIPSIKQFRFNLALYTSSTNTHRVGILTLTGPEELHKSIIKGGHGRNESFIIWGDDALSIDSQFLGLTALNQCDAPIAADIVAVTGLDGNAYESWKHQATNRMWLHDFLPKDLGGRVRIMTYGYDSDLQGTSASYGGILDFIRNLVQEVDSARRECRTRPLIFIGDGLGGILIGKALAYCAIKAAYRPIQEAAKLLIFFGVPHQGMDTTKVESMAKSITLEPRKKRMKTLVKHLRKDSEFLEAYREEVVEILGACSIVSLYGVQASMDTTRAGDGSLDPQNKSTRMHKVAEKSSYLLYMKNETRIPVLSDDESLAKFPNRADPVYERLVAHINATLKEFTVAKPPVRALYKEPV